MPAPRGADLEPGDTQHPGDRTTRRFEPGGLSENLQQGLLGGVLGLRGRQMAPREAAEERPEGREGRMEGGPVPCRQTGQETLQIGIEPALHPVFTQALVMLKPALRATERAAATRLRDLPGRQGDARN